MTPDDFAIQCMCDLLLSSDHANAANFFQGCLDIWKDALTQTFAPIFSIVRCVSMADRKGKPAPPMKTLTKKEQEELKKKVRRVWVNAECTLKV